MLRGLRISHPRSGWPYVSAGTHTPHPHLAASHVSGSFRDGSPHFSALLATIFLILFIRIRGMLCRTRHVDVLERAFRVGFMAWTYTQVGGLPRRSSLCNYVMPVLVA